MGKMASEEQEHDKSETKRRSMDNPVNIRAKSTSLTKTGARISKEELILYPAHLDTLNENQSQERQTYRASWDENIYTDVCEFLTYITHITYLRKLSVMSINSCDSGYDSKRETKILETEEQYIEDENELTGATQT